MVHVRRWPKIAAWCLVAAIVLPWGVGSTIALVGVTQPAGCTAPYRAWALTWPLFKFGTQAYRDWFVDWSFTLCR
jgi:hypothetical protein